MNKLILLLLHHNTRTPEALRFIDSIESKGISVAVLNRLSAEIDDAALYLCDDQMLIQSLESQSAAVIGCELDSTLSCQNIATDIWSLDAEYLKERYDFIVEKSHCYYSTDDFDFCSMDYETYEELFRLHTKEPYYLPASLQTYTEDDLRKHFTTLRQHSQLDELVRPYCIQSKHTGQIIGNIALSERSDCTRNDLKSNDLISNNFKSNIFKTNDFVPNQYTLNYYILPEFRGHGYAAKAIRQFLAQLAPTSPITVAAEVHKDNLASQRVLAKLRKEGFLLTTYANDKRIVYDLDELLSS